MKIISAPGRSAITETRDPNWVPDEVDINKPSVARIYDYFLGGGHSFAVDREFAEKALLVHPHAPEMARLNRAFLRRAVVFMVHRGIRQFLDLGSGIPTVGNVHEIAQSRARASRVVYVDKEDVAVAHTRLMLEHNWRATMVHSDATRVDDVLNAPETRQLLDFDRPIGLLALTLFHYVPDDPFAVAERYRDALAPGSCLAISHLCSDLMSDAENDRLVGLVGKTRDSLYPRGSADVARLFGDFDLVAPGLVTASRWRPDPGSGHSEVLEGDRLLVGVARKPVD
ncbi:SAM-dependent methyltransferase [Allokutzneria sp. A3M-2-11 16]|uniref:SAM-dependent methyltransferase n=1 Tax=Allokutzneria sp. A3M-2-11 16 TaxID=2962043 RepID=UPI0020B64351|nr:SAM-dependent methyltransferase [Allokutzneria sp. A3M-2-11 16]MCP3801138.1 SAM-dependent methyltransferase [Allokutzneria sp. A3M-2-11 16]